MIDIIAIAVVFLIFSLFSGKLEKSIINAPIFFLIAGIIINSDLAKNLGTNNIAPILFFVGVATLGLSFFNNAARTGFSAFKGDISLSSRLLFIALPLTVVLGTLFSFWLIPEVGWLESALLAIILAPSDTNLIGGVLRNPHVPPRIRQAISLESNVNDGLTTPLATIFIILAKTRLDYEVVMQHLIVPVLQILIALAVGIFVGGAGGWIMQKAEKKKWMLPHFRGLVFPSLTVLALSMANYFGGNYFIASFVAGISLSIFDKKIRKKELVFSNTLMNMLSLLIFIFLGQTLYRVWEDITWQIFLYAFLSLTLIRILPVFISMWRTKLQPVSSLFMGWFGARGLASIVLATVVVGSVPDVPNGDTIVHTVIVTVSMSIVLHGITALPLSKWYGKHIQKLSSSIPEMDIIEEDAFPFVLEHGFAEYQEKWE